MTRIYVFIYRPMTDDNRDETSCLFVSSRGLLKSCDIHSKTPKSSCPVGLEYIQDFIATSAAAAVTTAAVTSVYICSDAFQTFITEYAPKIHVPYIVVSGDGDKTMFRETVPQKPNAFLMFLLQKNLRGFCTKYEYSRLPRIPERENHETLERKRRSCETRAHIRNGNSPRDCETETNTDRNGLSHNIEQTRPLLAVEKRYVAQHIISTVTRRTPHPRDSEYNDTVLYTPNTNLFECDAVSRPFQ